MELTKLALWGTHHICRTQETRLYIIFLPAKSSKAGPTWIAAYKEEFPANGFSSGFNSTAPVVVMACRVDHASKVAAPLDAMANPFHSNCFLRFSATNSSTDTFMRFVGFRNAIGACAS